MDEQGTNTNTISLAILICAITEFNMLKNRDKLRQVIQVPYGPLKYGLTNMLDILWNNPK